MAWQRRSKAAKAGAAAVAVKNSPYVQRTRRGRGAARRTSGSAYESARDAVGRLQNGKQPTKQIFDDKKLQKDLKAAAESFRTRASRCARRPEEEEAGRLRQAAPGRHRRRGGRARRLRGPAQEGARRAVRRRGGVRVHLDHRRPRRRRRPRLHVAPRRHLAGSGRAPTGRPSSSLLPGDEVAHLDERAGARLGVGAVAREPAAGGQRRRGPATRQDRVRVDRRRGRPGGSRSGRAAASARRRRCCRRSRAACRP